MALAAHHASARKIILAVDQLLEQLETGRDTSVQLQSQISQHLNTLAREVQALEGLLQTVGASERSLWRKRIVQLQDQSNSQRAALGKFAGQAAARLREHQDREALFHRRHAGGGEHAINIDAMSREFRNLNEAGSQVDSLIENASAVKMALGRQGEALKGIRGKVLNMAATLGVSHGVLRAIERRQFGDKLILWGGMILTLALLWFVFVHLRKS